MRAITKSIQKFILYLRKSYRKLGSTIPNWVFRGSNSRADIRRWVYTWRSARRRARDKALERGERPSREGGIVRRIGIDSLRDLKSMWEELVESSLLVFINLSVSSLNAPTSSTTIFPPGCSSVAPAAPNILLIPRRPCRLRGIDQIDDDGDEW